MTTTTPPPEDERLLRALGELPPPPRKTDDAFARSVADGVRQRRSARSPFMFALPTAAAAAAAFALVAVVHTPGTTPHDVVVASDAGNVNGNVGNDVVAPPTPVLAMNVDLDDDDDDFALPSLEGSSDEELERLDKALDAALAR